MGEIKQLNQAVERFKAREAVSQAERFLFAAHEVGGLKVLTSTVPDADADRRGRWATSSGTRTRAWWRCWPR